MNINIRYFAGLREKSGKRSEDFSVEDGKNLEDIYLVLSKQYGFELSPQEIKYSLNNDYVDPSVMPQENDCLVFIPPVAGG